LFQPREIDVGVFAAYTICKSNSSGKFYISVMNTTNKPFELNSGLTVGSVSVNYSIVENSESVELKLVDLNGKCYSSKEAKAKLDSIKIGEGLTAEEKVR
jgi:hypothetical protein